MGNANKEKVQDNNTIELTMHQTNINCPKKLTKQKSFSIYLRFSKLHTSESIGISGNTFRMLVFQCLYQEKLETHTAKLHQPQNSSSSSHTAPPPEMT